MYSITATVYTYFPSGKLASVVTYEQNESGAQESLVNEVYYYDGQGRVSSLLYKLGSDMLYSESLTTYLYSEDGRLSGSVLNVDATYKSSAGYTYDGFGRLGNKETIVTLSGVTKFLNDKGIKDPRVSIYLPVKANGPVKVWDVKFVR